MDSRASGSMALAQTMPAHNDNYQLPWSFDSRSEVFASPRILQEGDCRSKDFLLETAFNAEDDLAPFSAVTFPFVVNNQNDNAPIQIQAMELDIRGLDKDQTKDFSQVQVSVSSDLLWRRTSDFSIISEAHLIPHPLYDDRGLISFQSDPFVLPPGFQTVFLQMETQQFDYHLDFIKDPHSGLDLIPDISSPHLTILSGSGIQVQRNGEMRESKLSPIFAGKVYYQSAPAETNSIAQTLCVPSLITTTIQFIHTVDSKNDAWNDQSYLSLQGTLHQILQSILEEEGDNENGSILREFQSQHNLAMDQTTRVFSRPYSGQHCPSAWQTQACHNIVTEWYLRHDDKLNSNYVRAVLYQYTDRITEAIQNALPTTSSQGHIKNLGLKGVQSQFAIELSGINHELNTLQMNYVQRQLVSYAEKLVPYQYAQVYHLDVNQQRVFGPAPTEQADTGTRRLLNGLLRGDQSRILHVEPRIQGKDRSVLQIRGKLWGAQFAKETPKDFNQRVQNAFWDGVYVQDEVRFLRFLQYNSLMPGLLLEDTTSAALFQDRSILWGARVKLYPLDAEIPDTVLYTHHHTPWQERKDLNLTDTSDQDVVGEAVKSTYLTSNGSPIFSQALIGVTGILFIFGVLLYYRQLYNKWTLEEKEYTAKVREEEDQWPPYKDLEGIEIDVPNKWKDDDALGSDDDNDLPRTDHETTSPSSSDPNRRKSRTFSESTNDTEESYMKEVFLDDDFAETTGFNTYANLVRQNSIDRSVSSFSSTDGSIEENIFLDEEPEKLGLLQNDHETKKRREHSKRSKNKRKSDRVRSEISSSNKSLKHSRGSMTNKKKGPSRTSKRKLARQDSEEGTVFSWERQPSTSTLGSTGSLIHSCSDDNGSDNFLVAIPSSSPRLVNRKIQDVAKQRNEEARAMLRSTNNNRSEESPGDLSSDSEHCHVDIPVPSPLVSEEMNTTTSHCASSTNSPVVSPVFSLTNPPPQEGDHPPHQLPPRRGSFGEVEPRPAHPFMLERSQSVSSLGSHDDPIFSSDDESENSDAGNPLFWFNALQPKRHRQISTQDNDDPPLRPPVSAPAVKMTRTTNHDQHRQSTKNRRSSSKKAVPSNKKKRSKRVDK